MIWYSNLFKNFPQFVVIHRFKGFGIVNEAEVEVFLEFLCFFCNPVDVGNMISGSSAFSGASQVAQRVKHLPAMQETWVRSLGWEGPLEKEMVTHLSVLTWRIPWTEEPGGLQPSMSRKESDTTERLPHK